MQLGNDDSFEYYNGYKSEITKPRTVTCEYAKSGRSTCKICRQKIQIRELRFGTHQTAFERYDEITSWLHPQCLKNFQSIEHVFKRMKPDKKGNFTIQDSKILIPTDQQYVQEILKEIYDLKIGDNSTLIQNKETPNQEKEYVKIPQKQDVLNKTEQKEQLPKIKKNAKKRTSAQMDNQRKKLQQQIIDQEFVNENTELSDFQDKKKIRVKQVQIKNQKRKQKDQKVKK
ncbi:hypothetical protein PPERSA_02255 [Pseudocohnilembus persalinus]|uniref:PARP-type domain-containing protein n=1 Tax=Pseudocohnilembus persalinus TaxID=266149 RepID=A0A0V0QKH3_PSEPJ|nr:hypothetical protein PPERSA_02255 [Pseudocohnilembus persalinus]|eukprot:KRX02765.1 hypothetical protein PPERSA_02255 [Pseudocohnilembus persalinus]